MGNLRIGTDRLTANAAEQQFANDRGQTIISGTTPWPSTIFGRPALSEMLLGLANGGFYFGPPDPTSRVANLTNELPYWLLTDQSAGRIIVTWDGTSASPQIQIDPTAALAGDSLTLSSNSLVITDDNIGLRQRLIISSGSSGSAPASSQYSVAFNATYYDKDDAVISTRTVGTLTDLSTWSSGVTGFTTSQYSSSTHNSNAGGTTKPAFLPIGTPSVGAAYQDPVRVQIDIVITVTTNVSSTLKPTISSVVLNSLYPTGGLVTETFTSNGTWYRPAGVDSLVAVVAVGGGGGAQEGSIQAARTTTAPVTKGGAGGGGSRWAIIRDLYVGNVSSVTVGIGTGGAGNSAQTFFKTAGSTTTKSVVNPANAANGNSTTFGTYLTVPGGSGATFAAGARTGGVAGATITSTVYDNASQTGGAGSSEGAGSGLTPTAAGASGSSSFANNSFTPAGTAGTSGGNGSGSGTTQTTSTGGSGGAAGYGGGGGGGSGSDITTGTATVGTATAGGAGGGGGGGAGRAMYINSTATRSLTAGDGGNAAANSGAGGGGGGGATIASTTTANYDNSAITLTGGRGGNGADGLLIVVYSAA